MNATLERKQERIAYCMEHMTFGSDRLGAYARVSSATDRGNKSYRVDVNESGNTPVSTHCSCGASIEQCIHRIAVDTHYENQKQPSEPARCGGCGCDLATTKNCTANFCLWNSFYTEGLRLQEDQRLKQAVQAQQEEVIEPVVEETKEKSIFTHCQGCGGAYAKGDCTPVFCKWNSFYTEGLRRQEDEYNKQLLPGYFNGCKPVVRREHSKVYNRFSSVA